MSRRMKETRKAIAAELERLGVADYEFVKLSKHQSVRFEIGGVKCIQVFATSPSDSMAITACLVEMRRKVRFAREGLRDPRLGDSSSNLSAVGRSGCSSHARSST